LIVSHSKQLWMTQWPYLCKSHYRHFLLFVE
jgi:hypothetical protein